MWLLKTWNVANATEKLNLKLYFIYFNINYHIWQIAIVLDCIALEENAICTFHNCRCAHWLLHEHRKLYKYLALEFIKVAS